MKKLVRFRWDKRGLFRGARILHPPQVDAAPTNFFTVPKGMRTAGVLHKPYICAGILHSGGKTVLVAVNIADRSVTCTLTLPKEVSLGSDPIVTGDGTATFLTAHTIECTVKGESLICVELRRI